MYICSNCGNKVQKWAGKCNSCGEWNTFVLDENFSNKKKNKFNNISYKASFSLKDINDIEDKLYIKSNIEELNNVLGKGLAMNSVVLLSGEPGIGKSTLILQILNSIKNSLYISGEESAKQILLRAKRLNINLDNFNFLNETKLENIIETVIREKPQLLIIDSIQTIYSEEIPNEAGNISQIRLSTNKLVELSNKLDIAIIIIGHLTKDGAVAGPKSLEHLVDVVLYLEGDPNYGYRTLRASKNRFGSTNTMGLFEMTSTGLKEIKDPTLFFLEKSLTDNNNSIFSFVNEGQRSFLVEIQALVSKSSFGYPQRRAIGFDLNRLQMIIAILSKKLSINLENQDIYLNIVGGLKIKDMGADLAVALAILKSFYNIENNKNLLAIGEIGLNGEIRSVAFIKDKIKNAINLGFTEIITSKSIKNKENQNIKYLNNIIELKNIFK